MPAIVRPNLPLSTHPWLDSVPPPPVTSWRMVSFVSCLDRTELVYRITAGPVLLEGRGMLWVIRASGGIQAKVISETARPNPFEFVFQRFWLTKRGMLVLARACLGLDGPGDQCVRPLRPLLPDVVALARAAVRHGPDPSATGLPAPREN